MSAAVMPAAAMMMVHVRLVTSVLVPDHLVMILRQQFAAFAMPQRLSNAEIQTPIPETLVVTSHAAVFAMSARMCRMKMRGMVVRGSWNCVTMVCSAGADVDPAMVRCP